MVPYPPPYEADAYPKRQLLVPHKRRRDSLEKIRSIMQWFTSMRAVDAWQMVKFFCSTTSAVAAPSPTAAAEADDHYVALAAEPLDTAQANPAWRTRKCVICRQAVRSTRFNCGHALACSACAACLLEVPFARCPTCREPISSVERDEPNAIPISRQPTFVSPDNTSGLGGTAMSLWVRQARVRAFACLAGCCAPGYLSQHVWPVVSLQLRQTRPLASPS